MSEELESGADQPAIAETPVATENLKAEYVTIDVLNQKFSEIQESLNKAVNGIAKKFESKLQETSKATAETTEKELTIAALKKDSEAQINAVREESQKQLDELKQQLAQKEQTEFSLSVRTRIAELFAKQGFDDVDAARQVFMATHPEGNYQKGSDGYLLYKKAEGDSTTLDTLIGEWASSPIGKRFMPAPPIPNGTGVKEKRSPVEKVDTDEGLTRTEKLLKAKKIKF